MGKGNSGHQKVDHGGDFIQIPRRVMRSPAYLSLSCRARSALLVVLDGFTGFNNGKIGLSIKNLGAALGNQNDGANSRAIAELIEHGLLECMSDASHVKSRAREYRVTFIASRAGAATNEWRGWTAGNGKKIGAEATAARKRKLAEATAARRKVSTEATAARGTETRRVGGRFRAEATAAHIGNQYIPPAAVDLDVGNSSQSIDELRTALNAFLATGAASAADVCRAIDLPGGTMSKFRNGRGLPDAFRGPLHWELGKRGALTGQPALPVKQIDPPKKSALAWLVNPGGVMSLDEILIHGADAFARAGGPCWVTEPRHAA